MPLSNRFSSTSFTLLNFSLDVTLNDSKHQNTKEMSINWWLVDIREVRCRLVKVVGLLLRMKNDNRRDGVAVRASTSQSVDLAFISQV